MDYDAALQAAIQASLEESAAEVRKNAGSISLESTPRIKDRDALVREDKHCPVTPHAGRVVQINTLNQFHEHFYSIASSMGAPSAICGFICLANFLLLEKHIETKFDPYGVVEQEELHKIHHMLTNVDLVDPLLIQCMEEIQSSRRRYVERTYSSLTPAERDVIMRNTQKQWVANYEIGDILVKHAATDRSVFVRSNQYPYRGEATPDEAARLREEARFGGSLDARGNAVYGDGDAVYFIHRASDGASTCGGETHDESSSIAPLFYTPDEWARHVRVEGGVPRAMIIDVLGHFVCALACCLRLEGEAAPVDSLILFNTTEGNYINMAATWTFDSCFC